MKRDGIIIIIFCIFVIFAIRGCKPYHFDYDGNQKILGSEDFKLYKILDKQRPHYGGVGASGAK